MRTQLSLVALLSVSLATVVHAEDWQPDPGFRSLFNGRDLTGWCFRAKVDRSSPKVGEVTEKFDGKTESSDAGLVETDDARVGPAVLRRWYRPARLRRRRVRRRD